MTNWYNYFVQNKFSRLTNGHTKANDLKEKILKHDGKEAYACYFDLDYDSLKMEHDTGKRDKDNKSIYEYHNQASECPLPSNGLTFTSYEGTCRPTFNCVAFDFDGTNDNDALNDVRRFLAYLDIKDAVVFFSGSKGFHVLIHFDYFNLCASPDLVLQLKDLAKYFEKTFPTLDSGIYNYNRKFRVPFTKHDKSGLYKSLIHVSEITAWSMEEIREESKERNVVEFLPPTKVRIHNAQITKAIEESKRASYEIEKHRAGTMEKPSPFEAYDGKLCIKKMLTSRCEGQINNTRMRIVNDFYRTGMTYENAEIELAKWSQACGSDERKDAQTLDDIYNGRKVYNFGCQDELKTQYCSAKCSIWSKLDPEKRPVVIDAPKSAAMESEKAKRIPQKQIAIDLLRGDFRCLYDVERDEYHGGNIIKQDEDLFIFEDDYWQLIDVAHTAKIKRRINVYLEGKASISQIENIYRMFLVYVPMVPQNVNMFHPRNDIVNFNNGVLEVIRDKDYKQVLRFRHGHEATDYLTSKHSLDYSPKRLPLEAFPKFHGVLKSLFGGESDEEDRVKLVAQMFGAALMPKFPMIFYFYGAAKTGKSSLILILKQLLDEANLCSLQPKDFHGFELEAMVGKLVNYFTDVNTRKPIDEDIIKVILDRTPLNVRRKNKTSIRACMPSLHLFAGNDLMKSFEVSGAFNRRFRLIKCNNIITDTGSYFANADEFAKYIYDSEPEGILNYALWGLDMLLGNNGQFTQIKSSETSMDEWQNRSDVVSQFLEDITTEGVEMDGIAHNWKLDAEGKINRALCWKVFDAWQEETIKVVHDRLSRKNFFVRLVEKGHIYKRSNGHFMSGISLCEGSIDSESHELDGI